MVRTPSPRVGTASATSSPEPRAHRARPARAAGLAALITAVIGIAGTACVPVLPVPIVAPPPVTRHIGTNVSSVLDWGTSLPFVDVFKSARAWVSQQQGRPWGQGDPLDLTADGWIASLAPGQYADTYLLNDGGHHPLGRYVLLYDGNGTIEVLAPNMTIASQAPGRWEVDLGATVEATRIRVSATDPADPIRNIRFLMPGFEATYETQPFNPAFLDRLAPFNVLRFPQWMRTNRTDSHTADWSERATPSDYTYTRRGVPVEVMVQFANTLNAGAWFNIPSNANDEFVRQFATVVRDQLEPGLHAWVEYSNETWNPLFPQNAYVAGQGLALGLSTDPWQAAQRYHAQRAVEIFAIWESVFGGHDRFTRVLATQTSFPSASTEIVEWNAAYQHADVLAVGPYFHCEHELLDTPEGVDQVLAMTDEQIHEDCIAEINGGMRDQLVEHKAIADAHGLGMVAYEGGQHMVGRDGQQFDPELGAKTASVNRHPGMLDVYRAYLGMWNEVSGGAQLNHHTDVYPSVNSSNFGALENLDQDPATSPKYQALLEFAG